MIEEEEQAELFKRGHTETEKVEKRRAQQQTRRSRGRRLHNLNQLKFWRENGNLRPSSPRLSRRRHRENVRILSSLFPWKTRSFYDRRCQEAEFPWKPRSFYDRRCCQEAESPWKPRSWFR